MRCLHCESEILDGSQFCAVCGSPTGMNGAWGAPAANQSSTQPSYAQIVRNGFLKKRNIIFAVAMTFLTLGFYDLYWRYQMVKSINLLSGVKLRSPGLTVFLQVITLDVYTVYWGWCAGKELGDVKRRNSWHSVTDNGFLYMALYLLAVIFGALYLYSSSPVLCVFNCLCAVVPDALIQHEINELIAAV